MNNTQIAWLVSGGIAGVLVAGFFVTLLPEIRRFMRTKKIGPRRTH